MIEKILPENCLPKALCVFDMRVCHWQKPKHGKEKFKLQRNLIELEFTKYKMRATWMNKETQNTECTCMSEETGVAVIRTTGISGSQLTILATIIPYYRSNLCIQVNCQKNPLWRRPIFTRTFGHLRGQARFIWHSGSGRIQLMDSHFLSLKPPLSSSWPPLPSNQLGQHQHQHQH